MNSNREYWLVKYYFYPITYDENFVQSEIIAFEKKEKALIFQKLYTNDRFEAELIHVQEIENEDDSI